jgi:hypothetical protein
VSRVDRCLDSWKGTNSFARQRMSSGRLSTETPHDLPMSDFREPAEGPMAEVPFTLSYDLTRRQRLVPHLRIWGPAIPAILLFVVGSAVLAALRWWLVPLVLFWVWFFRGFFVGLADGLLRPVVSMHLRVEENALGFAAGGQRWWLFLDGLTSIQELTPGIWTLQHWNGTVIHIPAAAIMEGQLAHLRAAMERGRTPEGVQAVIERGRLFTEMDAEERRRQDG